MPLNSTKTCRMVKWFQDWPYFSILIFSSWLSRRTVWVLTSMCKVGGEWCVSVCRRDCPSRSKTQPFSLNRAEQLVSGVDAGHIMHIHTSRQTQTRMEWQRGRQWASGGPVMCSQRIDADRLHLLLLCCCYFWGMHNRWLKHNCLSAFCITSLSADSSLRF